MSDRSIVDEARSLCAAATPGPWRSGWDDEPDDEAPIIASDAGSPVVAGMWWDGPRGACTREDAALIARAPSLLAALCDALDGRDARIAELEAELAAERGELAGGDDPCRHEVVSPLPSGDTRCDLCGAVARWPDDPDAECGMADECTWPACMTGSRPCPGPLGDGMPPVWALDDGGTP